MAPDASTGITQQQLCVDVGTAYCGKVYSCDELAPLRGAYPTESDCEAHAPAACAMQASPFCQPGQTFHGDKAQMCFDAIKNTPCAQLFVIAGARPAVCDAVCTGGGGATGAGGAGGVGGAGAAGGAGGHG